MERKNGPPEQPRRNNERQGGVPYNQLAEDMAQHLADLQVPGANNEAGTREVSRTENETESIPGPLDPPQRQDGRERRNPYQQLAADMAQPLADLQVPGDNNETTRGDDGPTDGNEGLAGPQEPPPQERGGRQKRTTYQQLAADMAQPLAKLRVPGTSDDTGVINDVPTHQQNAASADQQEATARRTAPAISDERGSQQMQTQRQAIESIPHQESLSEYNPDASCGSGYESCRQSSLQPETRSERETQAFKSEGHESIAQQESLSEYNENASCGSGFYRSESNISDYSSVQTAEFESSYPGSFGTDGFRSKSPSEIDTSQEECYSQVDGEPYSKRAKPNPEVTEELSLSDTGKHCMESTTVGDVESPPRQESIPEVCSVESKQNEYFPLQSEGISTQNVDDHLRSRNVVSPFRSCLSSEFEHMNLVDNNSVETAARFGDSAERSSPVSLSNQEKSSKKDEEEREKYSVADSSVVGNDAAPYSTNVDNANVSTASTLSQGARPKTRVEIPRGKKHKTPKRNTKNSYTELAKHVAGDLSAMNSQIDHSEASTRRDADKRQSLRAQKLFDGSTVETAATSDAPSMHVPSLAPPLEVEQRDIPQQPSLIHEEGHRRRNVRDQRENYSLETADTRSTSRETPGADAAAEHRSLVEEQQRLIDNMAPELQSMVIEMMQRDEEEQGGHVLMQWNPPVPPRVMPQGRNANQGACAEGASKKSGGKKSRKGQKNKGHYLELAGIIAPQLAAVNAAMVNGHAEGKQGTTRRGRADENHPGFTHGAMAELPDQEHETARPRDHQLANRDAGISSREQSHAHMSLPHSGTSRREAVDGRGAFSLVETVRNSSQSRRNGNRSHGRCFF